MYLRTVLRSRSSCRAIAETDSPCRCKSKIITSSPSRITAPPLPPIGRDHSGHRRSARRRASRGAPRGPRRHTWGIFKRRFWGESLRRRQHGKAFDEEYMRAMVEDHNKAVMLFQGEERSDQNPE